jgi:hypothetical protein
MIEVILILILLILISFKHKETFLDLVGRIGINNSNPKYELDNNGNTQVFKDVFVNGDVNVGDWIIKASENELMFIYKNNYYSPFGIKAFRMAYDTEGQRFKIDSANPQQRLKIWSATTRPYQDGYGDIREGYTKLLSN